MFNNNPYIDFEHLCVQPFKGGNINLLNTFLLMWTSFPEG